MDSYYKTHFLELVEAAMLKELPAFKRFKLPRAIQHREHFVGDLLYRKELALKKALWLTWHPSEGVERYFNVYLGWSLAPDQLPFSDADLRELHDVVAPTAAFPAGLADLEKIEGKNAIWGIQVPTPWDQLSAVPISAPKRVLDAAMMKAYLEAEALTVEERRSAVGETIRSTLERVQKVLPRFEQQLEALPCGLTS